MTLTQKDRDIYNHFFEGVKEKQPKLIESQQVELATDLFLRHKILTDLYFFGSEILGWKNSKKGWRKRLQPDLHRWLADILQKPNDKMILIPRLHLKSTWVKLRIVQKILQNPNIRILLVSETATLCEMELADIKRILCEPIILRLFPEIVPKPGKDYKNWKKSTANMLITNRPKSEKNEKEQQEPQVLAIGVGGRLTGTHFDEAYVDDMIGPESVYTDTQMKKREEWWAYLQSIVEVDAPITVTGTFYHYLDIYNKIIREKQFENVYIRKNIENGKIIYPNWFTMKDFDKIRKRQGEYIYSCQYEMNPLPDTSKILPGPYPTYNTMESGKYSYYIAIDPAGTTREWSDQSGFAIGAVDEHDRLFVEEVTGQRLTLDPKKEHSFADFLITKILQYHPMKVGMEMGVFEAIKYIIEAKVTEWENKTNDLKSLASLHNIIPIPIPHNKSKAQRISLGIGAFLREGKCFIKSTNQELMQQMATFTGKASDRDDLIDAANMLLYLHDRFAQHYYMKPDMRKGMTYFDLMEPEYKGLRKRLVS